MKIVLGKEKGEIYSEARENVKGIIKYQSRSGILGGIIIPTLLMKQKTENILIEDIKGELFELIGKKELSKAYLIEKSEQNYFITENEKNNNKTKISKSELNKILKEEADFYCKLSKKEDIELFNELVKKISKKHLIIKIQREKEERFSIKNIKKILLFLETVETQEEIEIIADYTREKVKINNKEIEKIKYYEEDFFKNKLKEGKKV